MNLSSIGPQNQVQRSQTSPNDAKRARLAGFDDSSNAPLMPAPEYVSVSGTIELLKMMLEISQTDRKAMKETKRSADEAATAAESAQLVSMRDAADDKLKAAVVDGFFKLGSAGLSAASGFASIASDGMKESSKLSASARDAKRGADRASVGLKLGAEMGTSASGLVSGAFTHSAAMHEVEAKTEEHKLNALRRSSEAIKSDIDDIRQHDSKLFDLVREVEAAMNRCTQIAMQSR